MIIPVRCFTCNKLIGNKWENKDKTGYIDLVRQGHSNKEAVDKLGLTRFCCRRMIISHVDLVNKINF